MADIESSARRRQEILDSLRQEREKRKDDLLQEALELPTEISHSFRSETIARLVQERRTQDFWQISKDNLKENIREEALINNPAKLLKFSSEEEESEEKVQKVQKREVKDKKIKQKSGTAAPEAQSHRVYKRGEEKNESDGKHKQTGSYKEHRTQESGNISKNEGKIEAFDKRIEELMKLKEASIKLREECKRKKDEDEIRNCSFAPQVTPYYSKSISNEKIEDRLMKLGQEQQKNKEKASFI
jgi:hypothetical protein